MSTYSYIINPSNRTVTVVFSTGVAKHSIDSGPGKIIMDGISAGQSEAEILKELNKITTIESYVKNSDCKSRLRVSGDQVYLDEVALPLSISQRLVQFMNNNLPVKHLVNFMDRLLLNPSRRSIQELYRFLENNDLVITEDGCFLAYKSVRGTYKDWHSNQFDNSPGNVLKMARRDVDDDFRNDCSHGFHVGAISYVNGFNNCYNRKIVIVKVNPANVVSVPQYDGRKCRVCEYEVLKDMTSVLDKSPLYTSNGDPFKCTGYEGNFDFAKDINYQEDNNIYSADDDCNDCDCDCYNDDYDDYNDDDYNDDDDYDYDEDDNNDYYDVPETRL